jgi:aminopeptidase N
LAALLGVAAALLLVVGVIATPKLEVSLLTTCPADPGVDYTLASFRPGLDGIGDPYDPDQGGAGYDAVNYDVTAIINPATAYFAAHAEVTVTLTANIDAVHLDLGLPASCVTIGGQAVQYSQHGYDLAVAVGDAKKGDTITIGVNYAGTPEDSDGLSWAVLRRGSELLIAEEPVGTALWIPVNGHPRDPATYHLTLSVPSGVEAISSGRLVSHGSDPLRSGRDVWEWRTDEPAVSYAIFLAVGQYALDIRENVEVGGRTVQYVAAATEAGRHDPAVVLDWLANSIEAADKLSEFAGEYPMSALGGLVPPMSTSFGALETHGRPVYDPMATFANEIITHELSHFWFGDTVTLYEWNDIVINEGMATYCEYLATIKRVAWTPQQFFDIYYESMDEDFWDQPLSDPGPGERNIFSYKVYDGGGMAIHAVRLAMGDEAFLAFFYAWAQQTGPHSLEQWRAMAQEYSPVDLTGLMADWFDGTTKPVLEAE